MSKSAEAFEEQQEVTKSLIREYNETVTGFMEQVKAIFLVDNLNLKTLNFLRDGLNELKKNDLKTLNKYLDAIHESYTVELEMFRDIQEGVE